MYRTSPRTTTTLVAVLALLAASPRLAAAQDDGEFPVDGDWSVMFTAFEPDVTTQFGLFRMFGDRLNVGLEAELDWEDVQQNVQQQNLTIDAEATAWTFLVGPSVRWYGLRTGPVSPYLRARLALGWGGSHLHINGTRQNDQESFTKEASLGIGAEWHPLRWLGVAGHTGLIWSRTDTEGVNDVSGGTLDAAGQSLRTFRSGLVVNFYFR